MRVVAVTWQVARSHAARRAGHADRDALRSRAEGSANRMEQRSVSEGRCPSRSPAYLEREEGDDRCERPTWKSRA